jgi:hypothetical protein
MKAAKEMAITQTEILNLVKTRLHLSDASQDPLIDTYVSEIGNRITHYCNVDVVPDELKFTWTAMVMDVLRVEQSSVDEIANTTDHGETVKLGDTSVAPAKIPGITNTTKSTIDEVVVNYRIDLNRYRKLRW